MSGSDLTDRIVAVCAILAALAAVLVAAYEARINREYQRISVWPRIGGFRIRLFPGSTTVRFSCRTKMSRC